MTAARSAGSSASLGAVVLLSLTALLAACGRDPGPGVQAPLASTPEEPRVTEEEPSVADAVAAVFPDAPQPVARALVARLTACEDAGGESLIDEEASRRADLDADGDEDWVLFDGWITCEGAVARPGLLPVAIHTVGGRARNAPAWEGSAYDVLVQEFEGQPAVWIEQSGAEACGVVAADSEQAEAAEAGEDPVACWRAVVWEAKARRFVMAPKESVRLIGE